MVQEHEYSPNDALREFWKLTGIHRFKDLSRDSILTELVDKETTIRCVNGFRAQMDPNAPIVGCGSCGIKLICEPYYTVNIKDLPSSFIRGPEFEPHPAQTYYMPPNTPEKYLLYPTFVHDGRVVICGKCKRAIGANDPRRSTFSLANGHDVGVMPSLVQPNTLEKLLIANYVLFAKVFRLTTKEDSSLALKGHVLAIPMNDVTITRISSTTLSQFAHVIFSGPASRWTEAVTKFRGMFEVRPDIVKAWQSLCFEWHPSQFVDPAVRGSHVGLNLLELLLQSATHSQVPFDFDGDGLESILIAPPVLPNPTDTAKKVFTTFAETMRVNVDTSNGGAYPSDLTHARSILINAFPWLLPYGTIPETISNPLRQWFMLFHDNRFSNDCDFIFYLFNQLQRHASLRSMATKVRTDPHAVTQLHNYIFQNGFESKLRTAIANPTTAVAKDILANLNSLIRVTSSQIPFSPGERQAAQPRLYASIHFFGLPSFFFTMAPCEYDSVLALRLSFPLLDNRSPSRGDILTHPRDAIEIRLSELATRKQLLKDNPVSAALLFDKLQKAVFNHLVGLTRSQDTRSSVPFGQRLKGCFGTPVHFFSVTECQGRGALHLHALIWGGLPPQILQDCLTRRRHLVDAISQVLDSVVRAYLPSQVHRLKESRPEGSVPVRYGVQPIPDPAADPKGFFKRAFSVAALCNVHAHSGTCRKGPSGRKGCRMNFPRGLVPETCAFQLERGNSTTIYYRQVEDPLLCRSLVPFSSCPVQLPDDRAIGYELKRPSAADANVVDFSPIVTACLSCNTAVYPIFNSSMGESSMFYLLKYLTKDSEAASCDLGFLYEALRHVQLYPSVAVDSGTPIRTAQHVATRFINSMTSAQAVSLPMAGAALLGHKSSSSAYDFWWCFVYPFIKAKPFKPERVMPHSHADWLRRSTVITPTWLHQSMDVFELDTDLPADEFEFSGDEQGMIPQHLYYLHRGSALEHLCFYSYISLIHIIKRGAAKTNPTQTGRLSNALLEFDDSFPQKEKLIQRLRSKLVIPILAGKKPIQHPGPFKAGDAWRRAAINWTTYTIHAFVPWNTSSYEPPFCDYLTLCSQMENWASSVDVVQRGRYQIISNITSAFAISKETSQILSSYRQRARDLWSDLAVPASETPSFTGDGEVVVDNFHFADEHNLSLLMNDVLTARMGLNQNLVELFGQEVGISPRTTPFQFLTESVEFQRMFESLLRKQERTEGESWEPLLHVTSEFGGRVFPSNRQDLNSDQHRVYSSVQEWLASRSSEQLLMLIHGGPGTVKSFLTNAIVNLVGRRFVLVTATTGIAAVNICGSTIHKALKISNNGLRHLDSKGIAEFATIFANIKLLIVDEISMMSPELLDMVSTRLQQVFSQSKDIPFGGLSVICVGDFYQLEPVKAYSLARVLCCPINTLLSRTIDEGRRMRIQRGTDLFKLFRRLDLSIQQRAEADLLHTHNLQLLRSGSPISRSILNSIKPLKREDIQKDPRWADAVIVVSVNEKRHAINRFKLTRLAVELGVPIIKWRYPLPARLGVSRENVYTLAPEATFGFVPGAPCVLTTNVCPELGYANGTKCKLHSFSFDVDRPGMADEPDLNDPDSGSQIDDPILYLRQLMSTARPGQEIMIPCPTGLIVTVGEDRSTEFLPLKLSRNVIEIKVNGRDHDLPLAFPVTLMYAATYHKIQGQTMDRVVLDLGDASDSRGAKLDFQKFFVGFSRVRHSLGLRCLQFGTDVDYLIGKAAPTHLAFWNQAYDHSGLFIGSPQTPTLYRRNVRLCNR